MLVYQLGIFVERVTLMVAIKCDCYDVPTLRNTGFTPLYNFIGLKIMVALFILSAFPLLVIYLVVFGIFLNLKKKVIIKAVSPSQQAK